MIPNTQPVQPIPQTTPTQEPSSSIGQQEHPEFEMSPSDLMYVLASYFYVHASEIGYEALKSLNTNLVIVNSLANKDVANARDLGEKEVLSADAETLELEQMADPDDTSDESNGAGVPSDNTRHD